jgi:hypothetical protein
MALCDTCVSQLPSPTCHGGQNLNLALCGDTGTNCISLYDYTTCTTHIPQASATGPDANPQDPHLIWSLRATQDQQKVRLCVRQNIETWLARIKRRDLEHDVSPRLERVTLSCASIGTPTFGTFFHDLFQGNLSQSVLSESCLLTEGKESVCPRRCHSSACRSLGFNYR